MQVPPIIHLRAFIRLHMLAIWPLVLMVGVAGVAHEFMTSNDKPRVVADGSAFNAKVHDAQ